MKIRWAWALGGAFAVLCLSLVGCAAVRHWSCRPWRSGSRSSGGAS